MFAIRHAVAVGLAVIAAALLSGPLHAQTQQQVDWCIGNTGPTPDIVVSSCSAIIQSGIFSGNDLAVAFASRAAAYQRTGEFGLAIQDYDQAIKLDPSDATAFYNRGLAKEQLGDKTGAEADLAAAKRIDPNIGRW